MISDNLGKPILVDLLADFLAEWANKSENGSEWEKLTSEAKLIVKYVIEWTYFETNTFLAEEILSVFRILVLETEINEENIGSIKKKIKEALNKGSSGLSKELQRWVDNINQQDIKEVIKEIYHSNNSVYIPDKYNLKLDSLNKIEFVSLDKQGKFLINYFYKENPALKLFIESLNSTVVIKNNNPFEKFKLPLSFFALFFLVFLGQTIWQYCQHKDPQLTIEKLCSQYGSDGLISCENIEFGNEIASNNKTILKETGVNQKWRDDQIHVIAVVVPDSNDSDFISRQMIQGVAKQQSQFNKEFSDRQILVLIVKESRNQKDELGDKSNEKSKKILSANGGFEVAQKLAKQPRILGVVGPYSSPSLVNVINQYCTDNLTLVSPTAGILISDLTEIYKTSFSPDHQAPNTQCFFRVTGTNDIAADRIFNHLSANKYKRILALKENDAFTDSLLKNLQDKSKNSGNKISFDGDKNAKLSEGEEAIKNQIEGWKKQVENSKEKTAILLMKGPKQKDENNTVMKKVFDANSGKFLIITTNPVYHPDLLDDLQRNKTLENNSIENIIIAVPWFESKSGTNTQDTDWFYGMSHDATVLLTEAISKEIKADRKPTREGVQQQFLTGLGTITLNRTETGDITLVGSDRKPISYDLIQPKCQGNKCEWKKI
jgi:ABC-type branched-subunit amino acid transport system substrate-binding protein